jgi:hypothetical protein
MNPDGASIPIADRSADGEKTGEAVLADKQLTT